MSETKRGKKQRPDCQHGSGDPGTGSPVAAKHRGTAHAAGGRQKTAANALAFEAIEPRILLSADPLSVTLAGAAASYTASNWAAPTPVVALSEDPAPVAIAAAVNPATEVVPEGEALLSALSAEPASQSQLSITKVEATFDPDGILTTQGIFITVKNNSASDFFGRIFANLNLTNSQDGSGPRQGVIRDKTITFEDNKIDGTFLTSIIDGSGKRTWISDSSQRVKIAAQQELKFYRFTDSSGYDIIDRVDWFKDHEIGTPYNVIAPGTAYLQTEIYSEQAWTSVYKKSNTFTSPSIQNSFPDLELVDVTIPERIAIGEAVEFSLTYKNRGSETVRRREGSNITPVFADLSLSVDAEFQSQQGNPYSQQNLNVYYSKSASKEWWKSQALRSKNTLPDLAPGESHVFNFRYDFFNLGSGNQGEITKITRFNFDVEFTQLNDLFYGTDDGKKTGDFTVAKMPMPDLQLEILDFTMINGLNALVPYKITNVGDAPSSAENLKIKPPRGKDVNITTVALNPGESLTGSVAWSTLDSYGNYNRYLKGVGIGNFTLFGAFDKISSNNSVTKQFPVVTVPDLVALPLDSWYTDLPQDDILKSPLIAGEAVTTRWAVFNSYGAEAIQVREDAFYWSKDATISDDDILAAKVSRTLSTESNSSSITEANLVLPAVGDWYLLFRVDDTNTIAETNESNNVMSSPKLQIAPKGRDLAIGTVTTASTAIAGEPLQVSWNALNIGDVAFSGSRTERVVLRKAGQQFTYDFTYDDLLQPGASAARTQSILLPATISGSWDVSVIVDPENAVVEPYGEANNEAPVPAQVNITAGRNLVVSQVRGPSIAMADQVIQVDWRVANTGTGATSKDWKDRIYLSSDDTFGSEDILLGSVANQSQLAAGAEYAASAFVRLPDNISSNFRIFVVADADGQVPEALETDNASASESFLVTDKPPQLVASSLTTPAFILSDVLTPISWTVTNSGTGPVADVGWTDSIFISADAIFDAGDTRVADFNYRGPLAVDEAVTRQEQIKLPQGLTGSFHFFVVSDSWNQIFEYGKEDDNRAVRRGGNGEIAPVDVLATNPPDLETMAVELSVPNALSGAVLSVQATIANNGATAFSSNWTDRFFLSADQILDVQDIMLAERGKGSGLGIGASYTVDVSLSLPGELASGTYYVIAAADHGQETFEYDRANNIRASSPLVVQRLPADLTVSSIEAPAFLVADEPSTVSYEVSNTGTGPTTRDSWTDYLFISLDDVRGNDDDILVGRFDHTAPLAAGQSRTVTASITPPLTAEGSYRLFVVTDTTRNVPEYGGEENNAASGPRMTVLRSLADLVVSSLDAPDTRRPGQVIAVAWQVTNQGDGPTNLGTWSDSVYLSKTGQLDSTAILLGVVRHQGLLAPGQGYTGNAELEIPPDLVTGTYTLIVRTDWSEYGSAILEGAGEGNNTLSRPVTLAGAPMRPDLKVSDLVVPQNGVGGLPVTLTWKLENLGEVTAKPGWTDLVYLSLDGALNQNSDILLGHVARTAPLNPGQAEQVSATFTLPIGLNGPYHVFVLVGNGGPPNETAKSDNLVLAPNKISLIPEALTDLRVASITAPTTAIFNEATIVSYTVVNEGPHAISQRTWYDRVFLSTDAVLDVGDTQLATVTQYRALDAGASYTAQVTAPLQGITPGTYYVIVGADYAAKVNETNETNNVLAAEPPLAATMPTLGYDATVTASLPQSGALLYYRLNVPAGDAFRVTLDGAGTGGAAALYAAFNRIPRPGDADVSGVVGYTLDQTIIVPQTEAGSYFIAVRGEALPQDTPFTLSVQKLDFAVTATSVQTLGNGGQATLRIEGALFDATMRFFLVGPIEVALEGIVSQLINPGEALVTFLLQDMPEGDYSLVALKGSKETTFATPIVVKKNFDGKVAAAFNGPSTLLDGSSPTISFGYSNSGGTDLLAPIFILRDQRGAKIGSSLADAEARPMHILGAALQGSGLFLAPGANFSYSVILKHVQLEGGVNLAAEAVTSEDQRDISATDWVELKESLRPSELSWEAWTTYWNRIRPQLGATWGEYVGNVNGMMVALTNPDETPVRDVRELFRRLYNMDGNVAPDVTGALVDAVTGQPAAGVEVRLLGVTNAGEGYIAGKAISDASGAFVIQRVGWGSYTLQTDRRYDLNGDGDFYDPELEVLVLPGANISIPSPLRLEPQQVETQQVETQPQTDISGIRFATDSAGRLHGVWIAGTDIMYSSFDGTSWSPATKIASPGVVKELHINFSSKLLDDTIPALLVTWVGEGKNSSETTVQQNLDDIFAIVGSLGPSSLASWSGAFKVTNDNVRDSQISVTILPDGDALLTFLKKDEGIQDDSDVYFTKLDLFSVNLPDIGQLSSSAVNIKQPMSPEREDFIFNRGDYQVTEFPATSRKVFDERKFKFIKDWSWSLDQVSGPFGFLSKLPGDAEKNKTKLEVELALSEKSLFEEKEKINQFILVVKKQSGPDVFGRLTQKDAQLLYHGHEALLETTGSWETKFGDHKVKFAVVVGGTISSQSPIYLRDWEAGATKASLGAGVTYTHETALLQVMKLIGKASVATGAFAPAGGLLIGAADGLLAFRTLLKDNKLGTLDLGLAASIAYKGEWEFAKFIDFIPNWSPSKYKGSIAFTGSAFGELKFGGEIDPNPNNPADLASTLDYVNSNVLKDALKVKVQGTLEGKIPVFSAGSPSVSFKVEAEARFGWFYTKHSWSVASDAPLAYDSKFGVETKFPGYVNLDKNNSDPLFANSSLSELSSASAGPSTTPNFDILYKDPALAIGSNQVYDGESLLGNVALDLYDDTSPTLTTLADGRTLAVWAKSGAELGNRLYSAIFDGVGWSAPTAISGTYGFNSKVTAVKGMDGRVSIIWTQADPSSLEGADEVTLSQVSNVLRSTKVFHSVFNGSGFSTPSQITTLPGEASDTNALLLPDGSILLSWMQTPLNVSEEERQSLFYAVWDGAEWSAPGLIASDISVQTHQLQSIGGQAHVIWFGKKSIVDQETAKTFVQKLSNGSWSDPQIFSLPSVANLSPSSGPLTPITVSSTSEFPEEVPILDVPPWPAINIDDFYNVGKDQSLTGKNLLSNDAGTDDQKAAMRVEKVNGNAPGTFTVTSKGGRSATITVTENGALSFTPGQAFQNLWRNQTDVIRFLYLINDVGSVYEGVSLSDELRTSVVEITVFGEDPPPEEDPPGPVGPPPVDFGPYAPPVVASRDPNDILGPVGHGPENWINASTPLGYTIRFENVAEAGAPARKVVITKTLDSDLDARSLRFGDVGFGDVVLDVPEGATYISQRLDLRGTRGVYVDVLATVDISTRTANWILTAIDPVTGDIPLDGAVGFLPPNRVAGEGQGFVNFRISVRNEVENGARIEAGARIVFDNEAPIDTPTIFNTIDRVLPTSTVALAGQVTSGGAVPLSWSGSDGVAGAGVASYTILVAKDGGAFAIWLEDTVATTASFIGEPGSSYAFYSLARDHAGLRETPPTTPDLVVAVPGIASGAVAGLVFDDLNQSGTRENGEAVLTGATVFLDADGNGRLDPGELSTTTDAAGGFNITDLRSGTHKLRVTDAAGMVRATRDVSLSAAQQLTNLTVGAFTPGQISGVVFDDFDGDGVQDQGEAALSGAVVFLDDNSNGQKDANETAVTTGANGAFVFGGLAAGPRTLVLDPVNGRVLTGSGSRPFTVTSGLDLKANFGTAVPGKIEGTLFEDKNGDGVLNGLEKGLSGWTVFLDGNGNGQRDAGEAQFTTGVTGGYSFTGLKPGSYTVSVIRPPGWLQTNAQGAALSTVQVQSASSSGLGVNAAGKGAAAALTGLAALRSDPAFAGITGAGIGVVVVDSGIDSDHPFFGPDADGNGVADRIAYQYDFVDNDTNADETFGHGTHIAGIIASQDATYGGVAPGADIVALRVLNAQGSGSFTKLEAALQWTLNNAEKYNIRVVNISMGDNQNWNSASSLYGIGDELAALAARDILVIAAAGNGFYTFNSKPGVSYPAADPNVIAVGAVWATQNSSFSAAGAVDFATAPDRIAALSQRDAALVDVFAPGMQIISAGLGGGTSSLSGTSQAAGFITGVAALAQQIALDELGRPLKVQEFISLLSSTSQTILDGDDEDDNVTNTAKTYARIDVLSLAQAIADLVPASAGMTVTPAITPVLIQVPTLNAISVSPGSNILAPIGLFSSFAVSGSAFVDSNKNGLYDTGEGMLAGANLVLDMDGNGAFSAADQLVVTTNGGGFSFTGLGPGPKHLGVQMANGQMFWLLSLSSTSRVNIGGLQLAFQPSEIALPDGGDTGGDTEPGNLPGAFQNPDPWRGIGPLVAPIVDIISNVEGATAGESERGAPISAAAQREGSPATALPSASANRVTGPPASNWSSLTSSALGTATATDQQNRQSRPGPPQSRQGDQQGSLATPEQPDPRQALDSAMKSLGAILPAEEARRLLQAALNGPIITLDEGVFEPFLTPTLAPERRARGGWVSDFLTDAGKVMQGPGDELVVLAAGAAAIQAGGRRQASGRETRPSRHATQADGR